MKQGLSRSELGAVIAFVVIAGMALVEVVMICV